MAAAVVWLPLAVYYAPRPVVAASAAASCLAVVLFVVVGPRPLFRSLSSTVAGALLALGALYVGFFGLLFAGSCSDDGHVPTAVWVVGAVVLVVAGGWSLQRPRRTWWGLPAATLAAAAVVIALATLLTGSTGACLS